MRTNSKQAKENLRAYIVENYTPDNYDLPDCGDFPCIARNILDIFRREKFYPNQPEIQAFADWCQGLPSILNTCYYYNRFASDDLGYILDQSPEEISRYTEEQSQALLTKLIYQTLKEAEK